MKSETDLDRITVGVNTGYLITHDRDALHKWRARHRPTPDPQQFSSTVARLAQRFPGKVKTH